MTRNLLMKREREESEDSDSSNHVQIVDDHQGDKGNEINSGMFNYGP